MTNFVYCFQQWALLRLHVTYRTIRDTQKYILLYVSKFMNLINLLLAKKHCTIILKGSKYIYTNTISIQFKGGVLNTSIFASW